MVARSAPSKTVRPRVLVTGFDAFGTDVVNPSWLAALALSIAGFWHAATPGPLVEPHGRLHAFCHAAPGLWHFMGVTLAAAGSLQWYRDTLAPGEPFDALVREAEEAPAGSEGLLFMPWLNGERSPVEDKVVRGGWLNMSLRTNRAMLVRSVLEGVALNGRWLFAAYEKFLKQPVPRVRILGGGAQSDLWCQIYADVLGRPVEQVGDPRHAQLRGVALWARIALGELTLDEVPAHVPVAQTFTPSPIDVLTYNDAYAEYENLYGTTKGLYHRLNTSLT